MSVATAKPEKICFLLSLHTHNNENPHIIKKLCKNATIRQIEMISFGFFFLCVCVKVKLLGKNIKNFDIFADIFQHVMFSKMQ